MHPITARRAVLGEEKKRSKIEILGQILKMMIFVGNCAARDICFFSSSQAAAEWEHVTPRDCTAIPQTGTHKCLLHKHLTIIVSLRET